MFHRFVLVIIGAGSFLSECGAIQCGENVGNCTGNSCCSGYGFCGYTNEHCFGDCQLKFGYCNPRRGGVQCGKTNDYKFCPQNQCCSKYGYCANTTEHCNEGCQFLFGRCNQVSSCQSPGKENLFPSTPYFQHGVIESKEKNYWFPLCDSERIFNDASMPLQSVTCGKEGSVPETKPDCVDNAVYKSFVRNSKDSTFHENDVVVDGDLVTCWDIDELLEILFSTAVQSIRDIRITLQKTHAANFTLEVLDVPNSSKKKQNITILYKNKFNGIVKYGRSIVFFANITAPLVASFQRIIRLTPHTPMEICEIEAASNEPTSAEGFLSGRRWVVITSSVIFGTFFLVTILLATILFLRSRRLNRKKCIVPDIKTTFPIRSSVFNSYSRPHQKTHFSIPKSKNQQSSCDYYQEEENTYEELCPARLNDQPLLIASGEGTNHLQEMSDDNYLAPITLTRPRPLPPRPDLINRPK